jgi:uncharacterized protein (TIGR02996 family)
MPFDPWDVKQIEAQAPNDKSIPAARQVLKKGGFERIESRADGTGWWAVCRGLTDVYNVTATRGPTGTIQSGCTCPSPKRPCKHALALLLHLAVHPELRPELKAADPTKSDTLEGLIAAVFASPDDDLPRLVLADYLEENGDADRAALIRVSCELAKKRLPAERKKALQAEEKRLTTAVLGDVLKLLPRGTTHEVRRGFLWLHGSGYMFDQLDAGPASGLDLFRSGWVESLTINGYADPAFSVARFVRRLDLTIALVTDQTLMSLATDLRPGFEGVRLKEVVLRRGLREQFQKMLAGGGPPVSRLQDPTTARIQALAAEGRFRQAVRLTVAGAAEDALEALADVADLKSLTELQLVNTATVAGLTAVGNSLHMRKLECLRIEGGRLTGDDLDLVGRDAAFPELSRLLLDRLHVTDAVLVALVRRPAFARLKVLALNGLHVTPAGILRLLAQKPALDTLHTDLPIPGGDLIRAALDRNGRPFTAWALGSGVECGPSPDGITLTLGAHDEIAAGTFAAMVKWQRGWRLDHLKVENTPFEEGAFAELLDFLALGRIPRVTISHCGLRNADAVALAARLPELGITHLDLSENKIGMTGAKALANSPGLASVVELSLRANPILKSGRAALAASPHKGALKEINLGGEQVDKAEVKKLRKAFGQGVKVMIRA